MTAAQTDHPKDRGSFAYRSALAIIEAMVPGSSKIPAADEETVRRVNEVVREFHPEAMRAWNAALASLSAGAIADRGKPFHELTADAQDALLRKWEDDPVRRPVLSAIGLVVKLVHFDRESVYGEMGGKLNVVQGLEQPRWLSQITRGEDVSSSEAIECDVVVIGTGAGGSVVGRELAERGHAVVFIEEGSHHRRDSFDGSSVRAHQRFYRAAFSVGNAIMPIFMGRLVGGSTAINGGTCFRAPARVLDRFCEELGTDALSASALDPYFARVEKILHVEEAKRAVIGPIGDVMARGCDALGWKHGPVRRNAPDCDGSGFCDFGCRTDARRGANIAYIPPALERSAVLLTDARVDRVIIEGKRARGVVAIAKDGREISVRARAVVLAGGAIPTPLLLLKQGIANASDQVGRNLSLHPSSGISALFDTEIAGHKYIPQGYECTEFLDDDILVLTAQPDRNIAWVLFPHHGRRLMKTLEGLDRIASFAVMIKDETRNGRVWQSVAGLPAITYNLTRGDVDRMHRAMIHTGDMAFAAGAKAIYPVTLRDQVIDSRKAWQTFKDARMGAGDFIWTSYHPLGTCQLGRDPKKSVVSLDHESHDVPGLFIADASTVPGPLGVNPQLTIMAMATRAAERIHARLS